MIVQQTIDNTQKIPVTLKPESQPGVPATLDGPVTWEVIEGNSTFEDVSEDGLTATLRSEDGIGRTRFKATGDADMGAGNVEISSEIDLDVIGAQAQNLGVNFGPAVTK